MYVCYFICLFQAACVTQVKVPIRNVPPLLVVQGLVSTAPGPYTIHLSYSGPFTNSYQATPLDSMYFINDARVVIRDDLGDSTTCSFASSGQYLSDDPGFIGAVGRTYTLTIDLANGQKYLSKPETILAVAPIDSLSVGYDSTGLTNMSPPPLVVTANTHDPRNGPHFYIWSASGYYPRKSYGDTCGDFLHPPCATPYFCECDAECEEVNEDTTQVVIFSNQLSEG